MFPGQADSIYLWPYSVNSGCLLNSLEEESEESTPIIFA